jgi:hypothetical protein
MAARADLVAAYAECQAIGDEVSCEQIADSVAELDTELRALGVRGWFAPLDSPAKPVKRSTRRLGAASWSPEVVEQGPKRTAM